MEKKYEEEKLIDYIVARYGTEIIIHYGNHNCDHKDYLDDFGIFTAQELAEYLTENKKSRFEVFDKIDGNKRGTIAYSDF